MIILCVIRISYSVHFSFLQKEGPSQNQKRLKLTIQIIQL